VGVVKPILILTAVDLEARRLARDLELPRLGSHAFLLFGRGSVRLAPVGLGAALLGARWKPLLTGFGQPLVISAGVCGGLDPALPPGALAPPARVPAPAGAEPAAARHTHRAAVARAGGAVSIGALVTTAAVVATPGDKAALHAATGAVAVDMESSIVLARAAAEGLRALVIRAIADSAHQRLPAELAQLVTAAGRVRLGRAVALTVTRPATVPIALALRKRTGRALGAVARALSALIG